MSREEAVRRIEQVADESLTELNLSGLQLEEAPPEIAQRMHLKCLYLGNNQITSIPEWLGQLSNLEWLELSGNQITFIPEALSQLSNLKVLDLSNNQITSIPDWFREMSNLTWLDLSNNQITFIPEAVGQLSNLIWLYLSNNQITSIPEALSQLSNLKRLMLPNNQITSIPETFGQLPNLIWLYLSNNQITSIPEALGQLSNLKRLNLLNNQITEIPEAIHIMKNLERLDLRGNPVLPDLDTERQKIEFEGYFDAETLQDARRRITASIVQRQGQPKFRRKLLTAYAGRCPITDCDVESAIEAAHIIPYQGTQTNDLPLRADIHTLFDLHLLSIRPDTNEVVIAPELVGTCYQNLAERKLTLPQDLKTAPNQNALSKHHEIFLSKCKNSQLQR